LMFTPISSLEKSKMNAALIEGIAHAMWRAILVST
jgi:hypothetical protein